MLGGAAPIGRFDQVHVARPLVVEINGEKHHTMPTDVARDEERYQQLLAAGFSVVVYWQHDIWHDAPIVRSSLTQILARPDGPPAVHRPTPAPYQLLPGGSHPLSGPQPVIDGGVNPALTVRTPAPDQKRSPTGV